MFLCNKKYLYFWETYIAFFSFIICAALGLEIGVILFKILTILLFGLFLFRENQAQIIDFEKSTILIVVLLYNIFLLQRGNLSTGYAGLNFLCCATHIALGIIYFAYNHNGINIKKWFAENKMILAIIVIFALLSVEVIDSWLMWDARIYYAFPDILNKFDADFAGVYSLYLAGHASLGYSLWLILFQLFKEGVESVQIADIVLAAISIFSYYQILRKLLGNRVSNNIAVLSTVPYAFSPFVLGIVGNFNVDSATMYFAVIFIACSLYHYDVLEMIFAFCFCFTKEPAVIYYVTYIAAKIICEYLKENSFQAWNVVKYCFSNMKNYIYALPVVLWMILSVFNQNGGWGSTQTVVLSSEGINCFGISTNVISMKLKQVFFLNFNWFFWGTIVLGIIILLVGKNKIDKEVLEKIIPMGVLAVVIIVFGCLYVTWTHVRYITPLIPLLYLIATIVVINLNIKEFFLNLWCIILAIILLIQSFYTIDPVMSKVFHKISVGTQQIYSMQLKGNERISDDVDFHDSIVYNRQYIYWQEVLQDTLNEAGYDGNMLIVFPDDVNCKKYSMIGPREALWNTQKNRLEYYNENITIPRQCTILNVCNIDDMLRAFEKIDSYYLLYIVPGWSEIDMDFVSGKNIVRQGEINNKGFSVQYMVMGIESDLPMDGGYYYVSPKQDNSLGLCTDGSNLLLQKKATPLNILAGKTRYTFIFYEHQVAMDVQYGRIDENGTVQVWEPNGTAAQKWQLEELNGYYMICWDDYALTYDSNDNSIRLTVKTGSDNQLWSFTEHKETLRDGKYVVSPKQEQSLGLCTDGNNLMIQRDVQPLSLAAKGSQYAFIFDEYQVAMDVQYGRVDENGTVWVWSINDTISQKWTVEKVDGYYMICWNDYALSYELNDNSIRLAPKAGNDDQLWTFIN